MQENLFDTWVRKIPWRRKWQPTPDSCLENPMDKGVSDGYSPWGCKESDTTEWLTLSLTFKGERGSADHGSLLKKACCSAQSGVDFHCEPDWPAVLDRAHRKTVAPRSHPGPTSESRASWVGRQCKDVADRFEEGPGDPTSKAGRPLLRLYLFTGHSYFFFFLLEFLPYFKNQFVGTVYSSVILCSVNNFQI